MDGKGWDVLIERFMVAMESKKQNKTGDDKYPISILKLLQAAS